MSQPLVQQYNFEKLANGEPQHQGCAEGADRRRDAAIEEIARG
jgi:hypothetical protein